MTLAESLNERTVGQYIGGMFLFRNKAVNLELKGKIDRIVTGDGAIKVCLIPESAQVRIKGSHPRAATGNELKWPFYEYGACVVVDEIPHGLEIEWKGTELYAKLERPLG